MTTDWWAYASKKRKQQRDAELFRRQARASVFPSLMEPTRQQTGATTLTTQRPDTVFEAKKVAAAHPERILDQVQPKPADERKPKRGFLGQLVEDIGLNDIEEPWDVLRPVKRLIDAENQYIAKPLARAALEPLPGEYDDLPWWGKFIAETAFSPSTYIGPGAVFKGLKVGAQVIKTAPAVATLFRGEGSARALRAAIAGGGKVDSVDDLVSEVNKVNPDVFSLKTVEEVLGDARLKRTFTQKARNKLWDVMPEDRKKLYYAGMRLFDDDAGWLMQEATRGRQMWDNHSSVATNVIRPGVSKAFKGQVDGALEYVTDPNLIRQAIQAGIPGVQELGKLRLNTLARNYKKFTLTQEQIASLDIAGSQLDTVHPFETAAGLKVKELDTPDGRYFHSQVSERPNSITTPDGQSFTEMEKVTPVSYGFGSKQSFTKLGHFATEEQGELAGLRYMPFVEAQQARIQQGGKMIMDKWLNEALSVYSKTPTELLPQNLVKRNLELIDQRRKVARIRAELTQAIRRPMRGRAFFTPRFKDGAPEEFQHIIDDAEFGNSLSKIKDREAHFRVLRDQVDAQLKPMFDEHRTLKTQLQKAKSDVKGGTEEYSTYFAGRYYPRDMGERLRQELGPTADNLTRQVNQVNNLARPLMATLDVSFMGVQGLLGLATNPRAYFTALRNTIFGGFDEYVEGAVRKGDMDAFLRDGGQWLARNDMNEYLFPNVYTKIPVAGKVMGVSNAAFSNFGNMLALEIYRAGVKGTKNAGELRELARLANLTVGRSAGKATNIETAVAFAPKFFRSQIGVLADALTKGSYGGREARKNLVKLITLGGMSTYMLNSAIGEPDFNWQEPWLDDEGQPTFVPGGRPNPNFMRVRFGGNDTSLFGPWDTLVRAVITSMAGDPDEAVAYLARAKASPVVSKLWDLMEGEDFRGRDMDVSSPTALAETLLNVGRNSLPISVQQALESGLPETPEEAALAGLQFTGVKSTPMTEYETLFTDRNSEAQEAFGKQWSDLEPHERRDLIRAHPDIESIESDTEFYASMKVRDAITDWSNRKQERIDAELTGKEWREAYQDLKREQSGRYQQWAEEHPEASAQLKRRKPANPLEAKRMEYYNIFDTASAEGWLPEEITDKLDEFYEGLSGEEAAYMDRNLGLNARGKVKEYRDAQKVLRPYWELADTLWEKYRGAGLAADFDSAAEYEEAMIAELRGQGVSDRAIAERVNRDQRLSRYTSALSEVRRRLRRQNPEIDAALVHWGYASVPIRAQRNA